MSQLRENCCQLQSEYTQLQSEYTQLQSEYTQLQSEYTQLQENYTRLQSEFSENTVIQSMNDMKVRYEELVSTTVSTYKYNKLLEKYRELEKHVIGSSVLIDHIKKILKQLEGEMYTSANKNTLYKAELELIILKEILDDSISKKNE